MENNKMTGFIRLAEGYENILKSRSNEMTEDQVNTIRSEIKTLRIVGDMTEKELCFLFDTSAFNEILEGYILLACDDMEFSAKQKRDFIQSVKHNLDFKKSGEALKYWKDSLY